MNKRGNVVDQVVLRGRCSGCGVCAGVCPEKKLMMDFCLNGDLVAGWTTQECHKDCALCLQVCPFANGVFDPRPLNRQMYASSSLSQDFHEDVGFFDNAVVGFSPKNRRFCASGGLLTWTMEELFRLGTINRAAVVRCEVNEARSYSFAFFEAKNVEELRASSGSVYHQVEISSLIRYIRQQRGLRWAITGVPCLCSAVRRAMDLFDDLASSVQFIFGMACGMYQNRYYTEMLLAASGLLPWQVRDVKYRLKPLSIGANNFRFQGVTPEKSGIAIDYLGLPAHLGRYAYFRCNSCNYCKDVFAEQADACYMDAWLPEYQKELSGTNLVITRNPTLSRLLEIAAKEGRIELKSINIADIATSQKGHILRKRHLIALRLKEKLDVSGSSFPIEFRFNWAIQKYVQKRSKAAWARHRTISKFNLATLDLSVLCGIEMFLSRTFWRVLRFVKRLCNRGQ